MPQTFAVDETLLTRARAAFERHGALYWVLGGSGSGKSTVCRHLADAHGFDIVDMDAHIYGDYHPRFDPVRHPANVAWSSAPHSLGWMLELGWDGFDAFSRAAAAEVLDLFAEDVQGRTAGGALVVDGGLWHPSIVVKVLPRKRVIGLRAVGRDARKVWEGDPERLKMKALLAGLPSPETAWEAFLQSDQGITDTVERECRSVGVALVDRGPEDPVADVASQVIRRLGLMTES